MNIEPAVSISASSEICDSQPKVEYQINRIQLVVVGALIAITDWLLYQGNGGYSGLALWNVLTATLLFLGVRKSAHARNQRFLPRQFEWVLWIGLLIAASLKLVWEGNLAMILFVMATLIGLIYCLLELPKRIGRFATFLGEWIQLGFGTVPAALSSLGLSMKLKAWIEYGVPLLVTSMFAMIFVFANPDAMVTFFNNLNEMLSIVGQWLRSIGLLEPLLWLAVAILSLGVFGPNWIESKLNQIQPSTIHVSTPIENGSGTSSEYYYRTVRNSIGGLIALFACYLIVEFFTMWFREFPEGFYYSGYAHAGAAWLTFALGLTTLVISVGLRATHLTLEQYRRLSKLSKLWLVLNFVLAVCVLHRLGIYIEFNGMTRMRTIALAGVTCVVIGLILVWRRTVTRQSFAWLVKNQIIALAVTMFVLAVLPIDLIVYRYNRYRIEQGDLAPIVQVTEHAMTNSSLIAVLPLVHSDDPIIREGVGAIIARHLDNSKRRDAWQHFQLSDWRLRRDFEKLQGTLLSGDNQSSIDSSIERLKVFAWKWY